MKLFKTLLALALAALFVAGCGGGGDSDDSTAAATTEAVAPLSKEDLISQGDAICAEVNAAIGSAAGSEDPDQLAQVSDLYVGMVDSIKRLGAPADSAGYSEFIVAAEELSMAEAELRLAAERQDIAAINEGQGRTGPALEKFQQVAGEYGFEDCGEEPTALTPAGTGAGQVEAEGEEGGVEVAPEEIEEEAPVEEAPEEVAPETGGAGGGVEEAAPEGGGETGGSSGGVGPG